MGPEQVMDHLAALEARVAILERRVVELTAGDPVKLVEALGDALAKAQGYDRPTVWPEQAELIQDPVFPPMEPANEAWERANPERWVDVSDPASFEAVGLETPPGEFEEP